MRETIAFIFTLLRPHRARLAWLTTLSFVGAALGFLGPLVMARSIDAAIAGRGMVVVLWLAVAWFAIRTLGGRIATHVNRRGENLTYMVSGIATQELYLRLLAQSVAFHFGAAGHLLRDQIGSFRWKLSNVIRQSLFDIGPTVLTLMALVVYVMSADPLMGVILLVSLAGYGTYTASMGARMVPLHEEWHKVWSAPAQVAGDAISNVLVVKSTQSEEVVRERMDEKRVAFEEVEYQVGKREGKMKNMQEMIVAVTSALIIALAGYRLQQEVLSVGTMTAVLTYAFSAFGQITRLQYAYQSLVQMHAARQVIEKELALPGEDLDAGEAVHDVRGDVAFEHVAFQYREDRPILRDVSFAVKAGERVAIVGESGEGKSTIVDLMGRYYDLADGTIAVDGRDIRTVSLRSLRAAMAYVPQDLTLMHDTLEANIRIGKSDASAEEVAEAVRLAQLDGFIASLPEGLATTVGERGLKLSGGERQRVALARAFLRKPRILVLDEPTSNLDAKTEVAVQESLRELMRGRTTFIIAHRLKTVQEMDRILVLKDGVIAEQGTHAELLARKGAYHDLLKAQHLYIAPDERHLGEPAADV